MRLPTKTESVKITMKLAKEAADKHEQAVKLLAPNFAKQLMSGDTLNVSYSFCIDYFGNVERRLTAVQELCSDTAVVTQASCEELEEGRLLVYEVLSKLDALIADVKARNNYRGQQ